MKNNRRYDLIKKCILIEAIIKKIYINYFHYKNIEECSNYMTKKYSKNEELKINNNLE